MYFIWRKVTESRNSNFLRRLCRLMSNQRDRIRFQGLSFSRYKYKKNLIVDLGMISLLLILSLVFTTKIDDLILLGVTDVELQRVSPKQIDNMHRLLIQGLPRQIYQELEIATGIEDLLKKKRRYEVILNALATNPENSVLIKSGRLNLASAFETRSFIEAESVRRDAKYRLYEIWNDLGIHLRADQPSLRKFRTGEDLRQYQNELSSLISRYDEKAELAKADAVISLKEKAQKQLEPIEAATGKTLNRGFKFDLVEFKEGESIRDYENKLNNQVAEIKKGVPKFFRNHLLYAGKADKTMLQIIQDLQRSIAYEPSHAKTSRKLLDMLKVADHPDFKKSESQTPMKTSKMPNFHETVAIPRNQPHGRSRPI